MRGAATTVTAVLQLVTLVSLHKAADSQPGASTSAGVYAGQQVLYFAFTNNLMAVEDSSSLKLPVSLCKSIFKCLYYWHCLLSSWCMLLQPDSCGYGVIAPSISPHLASFSKSSPLLAALPSSGCGACVQVTCTDAVPVRLSALSYETASQAAIPAS